MGIQKAVTAFIASGAGLWGAAGGLTPAWMSPEVYAVLGTVITAVLVWAIPNRGARTPLA